MFWAKMKQLRISALLFGCIGFVFYYFFMSTNNKCVIKLGQPEY